MKTVIPFIPFRKIKAACVAAAWTAFVACLLPACVTRSQYQKGYDAGASDTVKRQYWILQNMQKAGQPQASPYHLTNYRITVQPDPRATVKTVPYDIALPVYE